MDLQIAAAGRAARYRSTSPSISASKTVTALRITMAMNLAFGLWLVWYCGDALATGSAVLSSRPVVIFALVVGVVLIALAVWLLAAMARPAVVLSGAVVRIRRRLGTVRVPVSEVTGVGLVFSRFDSPGGTGLRSGWYLVVWHGGRAQVVGISYTPVLPVGDEVQAREKLLAVTPAAAGFPRPFSIQAFDPASETDSARLAATYAGTVARNIYQHVLARQGPGGPLATVEQQKHVNDGSIPATANVVAFWSPDGVIGRA